MERTSVKENLINQNSNTETNLIVDNKIKINKKNNQLEKLLRKTYKTEEPVLLEWRDINYIINTNKARSELNKISSVTNETNPDSPIELFSQRKILDNCSGFALPNQILAIMGPSGCGKTSLLNIIANKQLPKGNQYHITRNVKCNDRIINENNFGNICAYIMQDDILLQNLTPEECLYFGTRLKINESYKATNNRVKALLKQFGLEKCRNSRIGSVESRGISGGERKRTSIAYEVISNPSVIIIDEPTTGMDSFTSLVILKYLKQLALTGKTIICTIHQPGSDIFPLIDRLLLMKDGVVVYNHKSSGIMDYFTKTLNYKAPKFCNPFDFILTILQNKDIETKKLHLSYKENLEEEFINENNEHNLLYSSKPLSNLEDNKKQISWCYEFSLLFKRTLIDFFRNKYVFYAKIFQFFMCSLIFAGFYSNIGHKENLFYNLLGYSFNITNNLFINGLFNALFMIPVIRKVLKREYSSKLYSISAFYA